MGKNGFLLEVATDEPLELLTKQAGDISVAFFEKQFNTVSELQVVFLIVQALPNAFDGVVTIGDVAGFIAKIVANL